EVSGSIPLSSTINEPALIQLQNAFTECIAKLLLFNNPEQAENLKRRVVFILRNKNEMTMRSSLSKAYSLQATVMQ
ncbi:hypothetical protein MXF26_22485, partial [Pantoea dispersa]|uniref:hypothetical protein n=1 Tax=Pantoea dispersa TaxID=59814 RepID=UPI002DBB102D